MPIQVPCKSSEELEEQSDDESEPFEHQKKQQHGKQ